MKKLIDGILIVGLALCVLGCHPRPREPEVFGMPVSQWQRLTPVQQKQVIKGYNERRRIQEQNKPLTSAIGAAQTIANTQILSQHADTRWRA